MEQAVRRALSWHPAIDEATGRIYQSDERIREAQAGYYPKISAGMKSGYQSTNRDGWRPNLNVSASQLIYDFGKVSSAVDAEKAGKKVTRARLLLTTDELARDTASALIEVQRYRTLTQMAKEQVKGVQEIALLVGQRNIQGASTMSDKVQADARVEAALATQWQYESEFNRWQVSLTTLVGAGAINPSADVPVWLIKACETSKIDWEDVPTMLQAEAMKEEAMAQLDASRAAAYPTIALEAGAGYDLNGNSNNSYKDTRYDYSVGLNVSSSIYNGGQTSARKRAADYALRSADAALNNARFETDRNLMESRSQIGTLNRLQQSLESRSSMMVQTRDLYRQQYIELGTRTLLDLLNAEQELHEARFQIANTTHDLRRLNLNCVYNSGKMRQSFGIEAFALRGKMSEK